MEVSHCRDILSAFIFVKGSFLNAVSSHQSARLPWEQAAGIKYGISNLFIRRSTEKSWSDAVYDFMPRRSQNLGYFICSMILMINQWWTLYFVASDRHAEIKLIISDRCSRAMCANINTVPKLARDSKSVRRRQNWQTPRWFAEASPRWCCLDHKNVSPFLNTLTISWAEVAQSVQWLSKAKQRLNGGSILGRVRCFLRHGIQTDSGATQPPTWVPEGSFSGDKGAGVKADHSPPTLRTREHIGLSPFHIRHHDVVLN